MKKFLIASGIAALAFASIAGAQAAQFTSNLTVGSTGEQVSALQTALIAAGFDIPAISAGTTAKGYFGSQTKAAVMKYQASRSIPATGFVGPLTRGALNSNGAAVVPGVVVCPPGFECKPVGGNQVTPGVVTTIGVEGQLTDFDVVGSVSNESIDEGESNAKVLGVEMDAEDSDMVIERVDVDFSAANIVAPDSDNLDDYIESVSLWMGSTKLATLDVDRADDDTNDLFSFRFTGLKAVVKKDTTATLYVAVNAVNNVDSDDESADWTVSIPTTGIRAVDGAGISDTYGAANLSETFSVGAATSGELDVTKSSASPVAGIKSADETNDTSDITVLVIDLEADESDITISDMPVGLVATDADVDQIVKTVKLVKGSTVLKSKSIPVTAGTSYQVIFNDINLDIDEGETAVLKVVVDVNDFEGAFGEGDSIYATTTASDAGWDVEDAAGDTVTPSGDVTGDAQSFYSDAIEVKLASAPTATSKDTGLATFIIPFTVKATDSVVYLSDAAPDRIAANATPSGANTGMQYATSSTAGPGLIAAADLQSASIATGDVEGSYYKIEKGASRTFQLKVEVANTSTTVFTTDSVILKSINWSTTTSAASFVNHYTYDLGSFITPTETWMKN